MKNQMEVNNRDKEGFKDSFSTAEKFFMRISFYVFVLFGIVGLFVENWIVGVIYLAFVIFSVQVLLLRMFCRYCPYPYQYSTCLFMPLRNFKGIGRNPSERVDSFIGMGN